MQIHVSHLAVTRDVFFARAFIFREQPFLAAANDAAAGRMTRGIREIESLRPVRSAARSVHNVAPRRGRGNDDTFIADGGVVPPFLLRKRGGVLMPPCVLAISKFGSFPHLERSALSFSRGLAIGAQSVAVRGCESARGARVPHVATSRLRSAILKIVSRLRSISNRCQSKQMSSRCYVVQCWVYKSVSCFLRIHFWKGRGKILVPVR